MLDLLSRFLNRNLSWWLLHYLSIKALSYHVEWLVRVDSTREEVGRGLDVRKLFNLDVFFGIGKLLLLLLCGLGLCISLRERVLDVAAKVLGLSG